MKPLVHEKEEAIRLRRRGQSYNDILKMVHVAKSTLSAWLKDFPLTNEEKQYLKRCQDKNISHGRIKTATTNRRKRLERDKVLFREAEKEFGRFVSDPLFQVGIALYWAEGSKRSNFFAFTNSDYEMMQVMVFWIEKFFGIKRSDIPATLYLHKPYAHENCEWFWAENIGIPIKNFKKSVYKQTKSPVKKRLGYKGCLRVTLRNSTAMLRKMIFWQSMLVRHYRKNGRLL